MLSIALQFGSATEAANADVLNPDASRSAAVRIPDRVLLILKVPSRSTFVDPRRTLAGPDWKSVPLRAAHPALLTSDAHENKGRVVPACFRTNENCWNAVGIPDDCSACHYRLPFGLNWLQAFDLHFERMVTEPLAATE